MSMRKGLAAAFCARATAPAPSAPIAPRNSRRPRTPVSGMSQEFIAMEASSSRLRYTRMPLEILMKVDPKFSLLLIPFALAGLALAQVPPDIAKQLVEIGRGVCVPETAKI